MADSAFDGVDGYTKAAVIRALFAGESCAAIAADWGMKATAVRKMRDEHFAQFADPEVVKGAANGAIINANCINRPKAARRRHKPRAEQIEMFSGAVS